jgi:hypothetical protein
MDGYNWNFIGKGKKGSTHKGVCDGNQNIFKEGTPGKIIYMKM